MKAAVASLLLFSMSLNAAQLTLLDFEDFDPGPLGFIPVVSKGYVVDPALAPFDPAIFADQSSAGSGQELGLCMYCSDATEGISIYRNDSNVFELDSFDLAFLDLEYSGVVTGYLSGGGTVTQNIGTTGMVFFDDSWAGLSSVDILFTTASDPQFQVAFIDDITLQAVPVPAAVWLFASGLAGLGWLRRRQSV